MTLESKSLEEILKPFKAELEYTYFRIEQLEDELKELKTIKKRPTVAPIGCICDLKPGKSKTIATGAWTSMDIECEQDEYTLTAWGDGRADLEIHYCPKCGRKLKEE